jgi:hypothetical protein
MHIAQSRQSAKLFVQSSELGLPNPQARVPPPPHPPVLGGGAHSLARDGLGESQLRRGDIHCGTFYIYVLCGRKEAGRMRRNRESRWEDGKIKMKEKEERTRRKEEIRRKLEG